MQVRSENAAAETIERWRSGLAGPALEPNSEYVPAGAPDQRLGAQRLPQDDPYDDDYDYYWGDWKVPLWIALIMQVPWRQRLDIFVIGFIVGLVIAGVAVSWGLLLSRY